MDGLDTIIDVIRKAIPQPLGTSEQLFLGIVQRPVSIVAELNRIPSEPPHPLSGVADALEHACALRHAAEFGLKFADAGSVFSKIRL